MASRSAPTGGLTSSIRVVSNRTGIGPHTLRVWERRYGFPSPERRADGVRAYRESDIAKLRMVAKALEAGYRAGEVVPLPMVDLERLLDAARLDLAARPSEAIASPSPTLSRDAPHADDDPERIRRLLDALAADDIIGVQSLLRDAARSLSPKELVTAVAAPLAFRVGALWEQKRLQIRHEHLMSACLTRVLHALPLDDGDPDRWPVVLLATLPGEHHLLPLDMVAAYLAASSAAPRMLGADSPPREIAASARAVRADVVGLSISGAADPTRACGAVRDLLDELPRRTKLWLGGSGSAGVFRMLDEEGVLHVESWDALDRSLRDARDARAA